MAKGQKHLAKSSVFLGCKWCGEKMVSNQVRKLSKHHMIKGLVKQIKCFDFII